METNPYQAPEANMNGQKKFKRSLWWKVYFFIYTLLVVIGMASFLSDPSAGVAEYLSLLILLVSTTGFYGFVFVKPIYKPEFWLKALIVNLAFSVLYYFITDIDQRMGMDDTEYYITVAISWLISLPAYYSLYAYSKPMNPAWKNA